MPKLEFVLRFGKHEVVQSLGENLPADEDSQEILAASFVRNQLERPEMLIGMLMALSDKVGKR